MGGEKAIPSGGRSFIVETATVLVCMLLPAAFMHLSKAAFASGRDSPSRRGKIGSGEELSKLSKSDQAQASSPSELREFSAETPKDHLASSAKNMSQAVAAAVRTSDRGRAERLLGEIIKHKLPVDTMPF
ncbi:unnamed protein product, partial [Effrenium voratum]